MAVAAGNGYVLTRLGLLPEEWAISSLGELFHIQQGKALSQRHRRGINPQPFLRTSNVLWGRLDLSSLDTMDFTPEEMEKYALGAGDLLTCEGGEVGRTAIWDGSVSPCFYQNHLHRLRPIENNVDPLFIMYWMQAAFQILGLYRGSANRTTIANLSRSRLQALEVPLPPLPEQRAIARVLRTVQEAIEATERVIAATKELKRSLMRHLFTYGPVPVQEVDRVRLKETDFGDVPECWQVVPLSEVAEVQTGLAKGRRLSGEATMEVPYLRVANVQDGYLDLTEMKTIRVRNSEVDRYSLKYGDVVVTEGGDFDKLGRGFIWRDQVPGSVHQNHVFAIRSDPAVLLPEYLAYQVQSRYAKSYFLKVAHRTTHLACINSSKLRAFPVLVPSLAEQQTIVRLLASLDAKLGAENGQVGSLQQLYTALLHNLMTGKVRVSEFASSETQEVM